MTTPPITALSTEQQVALPQLILAAQQVADALDQMVADEEWVAGPSDDELITMRRKLDEGLRPFLDEYRAMNQARVRELKRLRDLLAPTA